MQIHVKITVKIGGGGNGKGLGPPQFHQVFGPRTDLIYCALSEPSMRQSKFQKQNLKITAENSQPLHQAN